MFIIFKLIVRIIVALQVRTRLGKQEQGRPCSSIFDHDAKKSINILFTMMSMIVQAQRLPNRQRRVRVESCLGGRRLLAWQVLKAVLVIMRMMRMMIHL